MRRFTQISLVLVAFVLALMAGGESWAKNSRGGSKGGGKGSKGSASLRGNGGGSKSAMPSHRGNRKFSTAEGRATNGSVNDSGEPWSKHYAREQRKLDHRKQVTEHLREISDRNGNEHLRQVADDMDERAQAHYDKQMEKIRQKYGLDDTTEGAGPPENISDNPLDSDGGTLDDSSDVLNGADDSLDEVTRKLTGRENALVRQLRNEERKLAKRMEEVERMRALAEQTGDEDMLQAADQLEEWAMNHFDQRMTKITDFQQRHGLPEVGQYIAR